MDNHTSVQCSFNTTGLSLTKAGSWQQRAAFDLALYLFPVILFLGLLGNSLAFAVLVRKRMRNTSVNLYLIALSMADSCVLIVSALKTWIRVLIGWELLHASNEVCKGVMFLLILSLHMSAWLVVAVSLDRWVVVWRPLQALTYSNTVKAAKYITLLLAIMSVFNCHVFWTMFLHKEPIDGRLQCSSDPNNYFMKEVFPWLKLASYSCIPFFLVLVFNICVIFRIVRREPPGETLVRKHSNATTSPSTQRRLTVMLLCVSFKWLLLTAPFTLWTFIYQSNNDDQPITDTGFFVKALCFCFMYTNHSINIFVYSITGNKFRSEMRQMFSKFSCKRGSDVLLRNEYSMRTARSSVNQMGAAARHSVTYSPKDATEAEPNYT